MNLCTASLTDWLTAIGTISLGAIAVFGKTIRGYFYYAKLDVSVETKPPDCVKVPMCTPRGDVLADSYYLRVLVKNVGNSPAKNVEVYAAELRRKCIDGTWEIVKSFSPMNLRWANGEHIAYLPRINPDMSMHCNVAHITDPKHRSNDNINENVPWVKDDQTALAFDLTSLANHKRYIVAPGEYKLDIKIGAKNVRAKSEVLTINLDGNWYPDETKMFEDGVGIRK